MTIPAELYRPNALSCAAGLTSMTGLISGIYHGINDSLGKPLAPGLESVLMFGPSVLGAILGPAMSARIIRHPEVRAQLPELPTGAEGCAMGCSGVLSGLTAPAFLIMRDI